MTPAEVSALAALAGSALGGVTPLVSNYLIQRGVTGRELLNRELGERHTLYSEFIKFATKVYVEATTKTLEEPDNLIELYAFVGRIRLIASPPVTDAADRFAKMVTKRYGERDISLEALRAETLKSHIDPLNEFSVRCRDELRTLFRGGTL
jgi:hypothetical protein